MPPPNALRYPSSLSFSFSFSCDQIKDDAPPALQAVRLMAQYLSNPESREIVIETLKMWLTDAASCNNPTVQVRGGGGAGRAWETGGCLSVCLSVLPL